MSRAARRWRRTSFGRRSGSSRAGDLHRLDAHGAQGHSPMLAAAFSVKREPASMYLRNTLMLRWPVCFAMTRSGTSSRAASVAKPERRECPESWPGRRPLARRQRVIVYRVHPRRYVYRPKRSEACAKRGTPPAPVLPVSPSGVQALDAIAVPGAVRGAAIADRRPAVPPRESGVTTSALRRGRSGQGSRSRRRALGRRPPSARRIAG
jgi:hypothetical protein